MRLGFFTVVRRDPQHYLHAVGLIADCRRLMPHVPITHGTDETTPKLAGVSKTLRLPHGPLLERRLDAYAATTPGDWLLLDTDVSLRADVSSVFADPFDVAFADRHWPHLPQGDSTMHTMPFNTGVAFSRAPQFWQDVLAVWRGYPTNQHDWYSEQRAVYEVVRTGRYRVRILPGMIYNYPPLTADDPCTNAQIVHYKGPRKVWLTDRIVRSFADLAVAVPVEASAVPLVCV